MPTRTTLVALALGAALAAGHAQAADTPAPDAGRLVTGETLTPSGTQTPIGSFPDHLVLSPDGRYVLATNTGFREYVSVLDASTGRLVSRLDFNAPSAVLPKKKQALYFGLVCGPTRAGQTPLYASRGGEGLVSVLSLSDNGMLTDTGKTLAAAPGTAAPFPFVAGLAVSRSGKTLYAADNTGDPKRGMRSHLYLLGTDGAAPRTIDLPGYPFAVAAVTKGVWADKKVFVSSEQRGVVSVVNPQTGKRVRDIPTGTQPIGLTLNRTQTRLFVANAGSDTLSVINTKTDRVTQTLLLRPAGSRGLPGATPTSVALSPDETRLYVTLGDLNAVAVVDLPGVTLAGYLPVGWYPTSAVVSPDGRRLFVANAKGVAVRNPNAKPKPGLTERPQFIQSIIEGTVTTLDLGRSRKPKSLNYSTQRVLANNQGRPVPKLPFTNPGIRHVFYVIKENRTYDQVLGDLPPGSGDPKLTLFGRDVTPNQHALASRFVLLDNFYDCAEVSGDGWNWSTAGMASEYTERNVPHVYSGRARDYDFEGTNSGVAVDLIGIPDAARPPSGYLWDLCAAHGVSFRNYGFFADDLELPRPSATQGTMGLENTPTKKVLRGKSDPDFREFDTNYADSEAWVEDHLTPAPKQLAAYGSHHAPSRITAWKREFDAYVKNKNLPPFSIVRLMRDHTGGTTPGASSPRAMVADNDYAVGQLVDIISHSPYWKSSAIVIVEDDAQDGYDHVDAHRSTCYVLSPFIAPHTHDSRFYNTDSALRTMELLLGLPPMSRYDAIAPPLAVFTASAAANAAPYDAVLPARSILAEVNGRAAYRAQDSARLLNPLREQSGPDEQLNDILWRSLRPGTTPPPRHYGLLTGAAAKKGDKDND